MEDYGQTILDLDHNSKRNDPISSVTAAADFAKSGTTNKHYKMIISVLEKSIVPLTNMEIAHRADLSQNQVTRRMTELERRHLITRCNLKMCPYLKRNVSSWIINS